MLSIFGTVSDQATGSVQTFLNGFDFGPLAILDFLLVGIILYWLYTILRDTRALGIIYGILVLVLLYVFARVLQLSLLTLLIANSLTLLFVAIPVLFQPELRRALERIGRTRPGIGRSGRKTQSTAIGEISEAAKILAQNKTGALIVIKRATGLADISTSGTNLDAVVSTPLLLNLFYDKSPLHDGAVIVDGDRIVAAGVMLPLTEKEYGYTLGARHRAAVGLTEQCDAVVLVVSEEKGTISLVVGGKITPGIGADILPQLLKEFLSRKPPSEVLKRAAQAATRNDRKKPKGDNVDQD
jgi:diadenylate cyclase